MLCDPASEERCSVSLFILPPRSSRDCHAVADAQHGLSTGAVPRHRPSREGTSLRARAEDNLVPDTRSSVTRDQGVAFQQWVPQVLQRDTRAWTVSQLKHNYTLGWFTFPHERSYSTSPLAPPNPACREEGFSSATASAADISMVQPPADCPCPEMWALTALTLADWEDLQTGKVTPRINGRGYPFLQLLESTGPK